MSLKCLVVILQPSSLCKGCCRNEGMTQAGPVRMISRNFMGVPKTQIYDNYTVTAKRSVGAEGLPGKEANMEKRAGGRNGNIQA